MTRPLLTLCDLDETYCGRLYEYLKENLKLKFNIQAFTTVDILVDYSRKNTSSLLVVSESAFEELGKVLGQNLFKNILVLDEEAGILREEENRFDDRNIIHTTKYQKAGKIVDTIIDFCAEKAESFEGLTVGISDNEGTVIGLFSPVSKCGQTTLALKMGDVLSSSGKTIMLSFDSFSSLPQKLDAEADGTINDLMYYAEEDKNKFCIYLEKIKRSIGNIDVIPPAKIAMQIKEIDYDSLKMLLGLLIHDAGYKYVILDLTEYPNGFFDILRLCNKLFTITRPNSADAYRVEAYEDVLRLNGHEDILASTIKVVIPDLREGAAVSRYVKELLKREGLISDKTT
ncbi:MAG: hypothetical protein J6O61_06415 [Butyrivibrio sp.]|uniref:hypothetical protein n=1 Tax=Butyrivibrio sp. TaxID=28121 RepID=UPI001AFEAF45|nr:hypothetical protein [Butyrivibrio sp.]MBO6240462.1 hypothetical protein [Butyrivibrio sp.]